MENKRYQRRKSIKDLPFKAELKLGPYKIINEIGSGQFGSVFSAIHEGTNETVAIKQIKKSKLKEDNLSDILTSEINIHKNLFHPNICQMYCVLENENYFFLVNEYCSDGDIFQIIVDKGAFNEEKSCLIFQQIISGLEYLHKNFICHRDIKPENILISNKDTKKIKVKITDFGLSKSFAGDKLLNSPRGSPSYAAPEMLKGKGYKGNKIDIWSSGVVLYVMVYGALPFDQEDIKDLVKSITTGNYSLPDTVSENCQDLIKRILQVDPEKRISLYDIKNHPWMNQFKFNLMKSPGIFINEDILPVDLEIIKEMAGNNKSKIHEYINDIIKNKHNSVTVSYYLRVNKKIREGKISISDFSSGSFLFLSYIDNEMSKRKYWKDDLDSRVNSLEKELFRDILREKESKNPRSKLLDLNTSENDSKLELSSVLDLNKSITDFKKILNKHKLDESLEINVENNSEQKIIKTKNIKIKKCNSDSLFEKNNEQNEINLKYDLQKKHFKNDKFLKNIDIEENKKETELYKNQLSQKIPIVLFIHNIVNDIINKVVDKENKNDKNNNPNVNGGVSNLKKKYLKQFVPNNKNKFKSFIKEESKDNKTNNSLNDENKNNKDEIMKLIINQLKFFKTDESNCRLNDDGNIVKKENKDKNMKNVEYKIDNEESKQQILKRKKMIKIRLPLDDNMKINNEKRKKIIIKKKFNKNIEEVKNNNIFECSNNNNNLLNFLTMDNCFLKDNSNKKNYYNKEEIINVPFKKHQKIKRLLTTNQIEEENKNNNNKKDLFNSNKKENINKSMDNDEEVFSFKTESTISKDEIVIKSLVNEFKIINKNENENNYNCQKIDEKGEILNFNLQIIKENDSLNIITCKLINGNNNYYEELYNIIKNIFIIT